MTLGQIFNRFSSSTDLFFVLLFTPTPYLMFIPFFIYVIKFTKNMKILRNFRLHFARQDEQDRKKRKENHATKVTKIPQINIPKYGLNKTLVDD